MSNSDPISSRTKPERLFFRIAFAAWTCFKPNNAQSLTLPLRTAAGLYALFGLKGDPEMSIGFEHEYFDLH